MRLVCSLIAHMPKLKKPLEPSRGKLKTRPHKDDQEHLDGQDETLEVAQANEEEQVQESLEAIYRAGDGRMPNFSRLERQRSYWWMRLVIWSVLILSVLSLVAWAGFFLVQPFRPAPLEGFDLTIEGPQQVTLGKSQEYRIHWSNEEWRTISQADIRLSLPQDFRIEQIDPRPTDEKLNRWDLGLLQPRQEGEMRVKGTFLGALGDQNALQVIGSYRFNHGERDQQALFTLPLTYEKSALEGKLVLPEKILPGDTVVVQYSVKNQSDQPLDQLVARIHLPNTFISQRTSTSTLTSPEAQDVLIPLGSVPAGSLTTVQMSGVFTPGSVGDVAFEASAGRLGANGSFQAMHQLEARSTILAGDFSVRAVVNGSSGNQVIEAGQPLRVTLGYQNTSPEIIKNASITVGFESLVNNRSATGTTLLKWKDLTDAKQGVTTTRTRIQTIRYDKQKIPSFESLAPNAQGTIEFSIPTLPIPAATKDASVVMTVSAEIPTLGSTDVHRQVRLTPLIIRYGSDVDLNAFARYYSEEGAPFTFGPLPPEVGKTTGYRIYWNLSKKLHILEDVQVSAILPKIVAWSGKNNTASGDLTYDEATRKVTWKLKRMPAEVNELETWFEVQLTPDKADAGRFAALLGETSFDAKDMILSETISRKKPGLTTDLQQDEGAKGKGVVRN